MLNVSKVLTLPLLGTLTLFVACGPDSELVASGKAHACAIADLGAQIQQNPNDTALQEDLATRRSFLQTIIETADEGDRAELEEAINEAVAEGC